MEVDDVVMTTGDDETSTGWCFALTSVCAVVGSTDSLLLDSGSDEHLCTPKFAELIPTSRDHSPVTDVHQNDLVISGQKTVPMLVGPTGGKHAMEVRDNILSLLDGKGRQESTALPGTKQFACRTLDTWRREQLSRMSAMSAWMVWTKSPIHSSSSSGPVVETSAVEPAAEAGTTPAPVLGTWSSIKELHSRLRELGAPIYGTKDVLFRRLCEYEQIAARKKKEEEYLESRRKELAVAAEPVTPKILPGPIQPSEVERQHHMVNHLPPAPWCELCVMGRGKEDSHLRCDLREKGEQLSVIAFDFAFVKTTSASGEKEQ